MSLGKITKIDDKGIRLEVILTFCTNETRRTFTVGRPPYIKSGYLTGNFRKLWPRCASSSHLNRQKRTFNTIRAFIVMNDPYAHHQISKQVKHVSKDTRNQRKSTLVIRMV